ncbi:MAG: RNA polymerase sigma factor [Planctomycetota bacterium]|jgi:RNA polymerase sigma factor (sigma-70 family)
MKSEAELLEASLAGNREAFGTIVERYQSLICGITYSAMGDLAKSEELAQETFIRAWKGLGQLKDSGKFQAWLCTIARNLIRKSIKSRQRDIINTAEPLEDMGAVKSAEPGPVETVISKEQEEVVWRALREIPEQFREPMVLFYREQQSVRQVATGLELSEDVAKQRLSRGRRMLKKQVAALVEETLGKTRPGKIFTVAVIAALPAVSAEAAIAAVAGITAKTAPAAKAAFASGLFGAVLGPILGLLGGLFGSWMSIKHTKSTRERWFMIKFALLVWCEVTLSFLAIVLFMILMLKGLVAKKVYWWVFGSVMTAHFIFLVPAIIWANRRQQQIQKEDGTYVKPQYHPAKMSKANIYAAVGGSIFGAVCWIMPISFITRDWLVAAVVVIVASLIFVISTKKCLHNQKSHWRILIWDVIGLCVLNLVVVNVRWNQWMELYRQSSYYNPTKDISLWAINLMIGAIFSGLLVMFVLLDLRQRKMSDNP